MKSQFADITSSSNFFDVVLFLLSSLVTGPSFMSISSLILELWQFSFIRYWPEIRKSEIPLSEFCPISGDWGRLGIPNLARMSLMKYYYMLQNGRVTAFTVSELLRENQQGGKTIGPPTRLGLRHVIHFPSFCIVNLLCCGSHFLNITFIDAKTICRSPYLLDFSWL